MLVDVDGYIEDGREIFDDDLDEASIIKEEKKGRGKKRSRADKSFVEDASSSNKDIQKMFANMPTKKKKEVCTNSYLLEEFIKIVFCIMLITLNFLYQ